ncbi:MAG: hypothetical protein CMF39_00600 [Legionellaceae bacterium]|nr:hypothetical protein [Legionellaceae bacterium]|tara:strand:+ start:851 stop:1393 length:543 start_codon:yes stop_codon:yes gene_type:complete
MPYVIIFAILEVVVFVLVGEAIGFLWAVLLVVAGSILGLYLLKTANLKMMEKLQKKLAAGQMPLKEMMGAPFRMFAGWLLMIPGIISSVLGLLCLLPLTRKLLINMMMRSKAFSKFSKGNQPMNGFDINNFNMDVKTNMHKKNTKSANDDPNVLEGEFWEEKKQKHSPKDDVNHDKKPDK